MTNKLVGMFNEMAGRAVLLGGAYGATTFVLGKDSAWRAFSYIPTLGAELTEAAIQSLVDGNFINPVSAEFLKKARYIGAVSAGVLTFVSGPGVIGMSTKKLRNILNTLSITDMIKKPFTIKQHWHNHPDRMLLTKQQTAALGATIIAASAVLAGADRTSWAIEQIRELPSHAADYLLSTLNITKEGWFSSATRPTWAKWAVGVPLVAGGWVAINTVASGILSGVNRVLKGVQTPTKGQTYLDLYYEAQGERQKEYSEAVDKHWKMERELNAKIEKAENEARSWKNLCTSLVDNIAPGLQDRLSGLADAVLEAFKKEREQTERK